MVLTHGSSTDTVVVHGTIRSRRSVDCSLARAGTFFAGPHTSRNRLDTDHYAVKCHQRNLELDLPRTVGVTSTSSRWVNVGSGSRVQLLTGKRVSTCRTSSIETSGKLQSYRLKPTANMATPAARTPSNFLTKNKQVSRR